MNLYRHIVDSMSITKYEVSGMTCGGCVNRVKTTLADYAEGVEVTLDPPEAILTNPITDLSTLNSALSKVGKYQLSQIEAAPASNIHGLRAKAGLRHTNHYCWFLLIFYW